MAIQYSDGEYIKLYRKLINWEWYQDINTKTLFLHLLLKANWKEGSWQGINYKRGQLIASMNTLAAETGLTFEQTRTAIKHLKSTGEITYEKIAKGGLITIVEYNRFQDNPTQKPQKTHTETQSETTEATHEPQQYKNIKEDKEIKNNNSRFVAPSVEEVREYCRERNNSIDADEFVNFYQANGWVQGKGKPIKDWKACVRTWENNRKQNNIVKNKAQDFPQRTYTDDEYHEMEMRKLRKG